MSTEENVSLQNLWNPKADKLFISNIPELKEEMLYAKNWIKSLDMNKVIMNIQDIEVYNEKNIKTRSPIVDLENFSESLSKGELIDKLNTISSFPKVERYHENGKLVSAEYYNKLIENCNIYGVMDTNNIKYGITLKKTVMRTFPTYDTVFNIGDNYEFDRFQETAVYPIEPLVILHKSVDNKWYLAQMYNYLAWIPEKDVAVCKKQELFDYHNTEDFIVTTGKRVFTNYNPLNEQLSEVKFDMGIKIPLVAINEIEEDIYGQSPTGNYVVKLPTRNKSGNVEFKLALIARNEEVSRGYLPYTRENILIHTFKFLGERYGWGGTFNSRDCASLIMDVYRTMGIVLPRNAEEQGEFAVGNFYEMSETMTIKDRERLLDNLKPGTPVYMSGHAMLYVGKEEGKYYIIHDFSGFYKPQQDGAAKYYRVREVMVSPLCIGLSEEGKTYIEGLYGARDFVLVE
ncbi:SH3 domain-containing protein [Clostridium estertheticum]|uniref:C40 family peptidase n=1 Tax=Clostridium estertheticum TaxID=238834 RepID=UPI0013E99DFE|nr:SH3 domain-containing protein [Clostridium estertheticum]MBZ9686598.1 SH3 domain-containing protein [Clostridium estertheticum]